MANGFGATVCPARHEAKFNADAGEIVCNIFHGYGESRASIVCEKLVNQGLQEVFHWHDGQTCKHNQPFVD